MSSQQSRYRLQSAARRVVQQQQSSLSSSVSPSEEQSRLTPTTLRRVARGRDEALAQVEALKAEVVELTAALEAHKLCPSRIENLEKELEAVHQGAQEYRRSWEARDAAAEKTALALRVSEARREALEMDIEKLRAALETGNDIAERQKGRGKEADALRKRVEDLERRLEESAAREAAAAASAASATAAPANAGVTMGDVMELLEKYKIENMMSLISERVFIHVVAPKTILKIGEGVPQAFLPPPPSDSTVRDFIEKEVVPSFTQIFATLATIDESGNGSSSSSGSSSNGSSGNSSSSEDQPPRSAVEAQLAPDGGTVRDYADKFSSILTGFIKKCVLESQAR
jgi:predicted RNase H-like nuclease (RuvC/YqgF family)